MDAKVEPEFESISIGLINWLLPFGVYISALIDSGTPPPRSCHQNSTNNSLPGSGPVLTFKSSGTLALSIRQSATPVPPSLPAGATKYHPVVTGPTGRQLHCLRTNTQSTCPKNHFSICVSLGLVWHHSPQAARPLTGWAALGRRGLLFLCCCGLSSFTLCVVSRRTGLLYSLSSNDRIYG